MRHRPPKRASLRANAAALRLLAPSPIERSQHDRVVAAPQMLDADGRIGSPHRIVDTLEIMEAAGTITKAMRKAGDAFRDDFAQAGLDPLKAADMEHPGRGAVLHTPYGESGNASGVEAARDRVWRATLALGGNAAPAGSCVWAVLGWQQSLRQYAIERGIDSRVASRILRDALRVLAGNKGA